MRKYISLDDIRMSESVVGSDSLVRIELKQTSEQIETVLGHVGYELLDRLLLAIRGSLDHTRSVVRLNTLDVGLVGRGYVLENTLELVERRRAGKHGLSEQHLAQNAPDTPHVDAFGVFGRGE